MVPLHSTLLLALQTGSLTQHHDRVVLHACNTAAAPVRLSLAIIEHALAPGNNNDAVGPRLQADMYAHMMQLDPDEVNFKGVGMWLFRPVGAEIDAQILTYGDLMGLHWSGLDHLCSNRGLDYLGPGKGSDSKTKLVERLLAHEDSALRTVSAFIALQMIRLAIRLIAEYGS